HLFKRCCPVDEAVPEQIPLLWIFLLTQSFAEQLNIHLHYLGSKMEIEKVDRAIPGVVGDPFVVGRPRFIEEGMLRARIEFHLEVFLVLDHGLYQIGDPRVDPFILSSVKCKYRPLDFFDGFQGLWICTIEWD